MPLFFGGFVMADSTPGAPAPVPAAPPSIGERISFSVPAIAVALLLSIGISYAILYLVNSSTREELSKAMKESETKLSTKLGEVEKTNKTLETQVDSLTKTADQLKTEKAELAKTLDSVSKGLKDVADSYGQFKKGQEDLDKRQNQDIATAN